MKRLQAAFGTVVLAAVLPAHADYRLPGDGGLGRPPGTVSSTTGTAPPDRTGAPTSEVRHPMPASSREGDRLAGRGGDAHHGPYPDATPDQATASNRTLSSVPAGAASGGIGIVSGESLQMRATPSGSDASHAGSGDSSGESGGDSGGAAGDTPAIGQRVAAPGSGERVRADHGRVGAAAAPDSGTVQVFGLGLVILATILGTRRRAPTRPSSF